MAEEASKRESGYYWVKLGGEFYSGRWEVAEYRNWAIDRQWYITDCIDGIREDELAEVGNRILRPEERSSGSDEGLGYHATIEALQTKIAELTKQKDSIYCAERNALLVPLAKALIALGYDAGLGKHDPNDASWDEDWRNIVYIEFPGKLGGMDLPVQASWHIHDSELEMFSFLPVYKGSWDGHTTEEKYQRIREADF